MTSDRTSSMPANRDQYHERLEEIGPAGQARIRGASVAVVGVGALGGVVADRLVRAGVGRLRLIDDDVVDVVNLQRQLPYDEDDAAASRPKVLALSDKLSRVDGRARLDPRQARLEAHNCAELLDGVELIVDGTDNLASRLVVSDYVLTTDKAWVYGSVGTTGGVASSALTRHTPCLRCLEDVFDHWIQTVHPETSGLLWTIPMVVAAIQSTEAIRHLVLGTAPSDQARLTLVDPWYSICRATTFARWKYCRGAHPAPPATPEAP